MLTYRITYHIGDDEHSHSRMLDFENQPTNEDAEKALEAIWHLPIKIDSVKMAQEERVMPRETKKFNA